MVSDLNSLSDMAQRCKSDGLRSLSKDERREFKKLFKKEIRKCAFKPQHNNPYKVLQEFCDHVIQEFGTITKIKVVIDNQPYLRKIAKRLSNHKIPVASLILYAAWIEHWTNMMITVAMLRKGYTPTDPLNYLKTQPRFKDKLDKIANELGIKEINKKTRDGLIEVVKIRHRQLHYPWEGESSKKVNRNSQTVRAIVNKCEKILENALSFEYKYFDKPYEKLVSAVFRIR